MANHVAQGSMKPLAEMAPGSVDFIVRPVLAVRHGQKVAIQRFKAGVDRITVGSSPGLIFAFFVRSTTSTPCLCSGW